MQHFKSSIKNAVSFNTIVYQANTNCSLNAKMFNSHHYSKTNGIYGTDYKAS